MGGGFYTARERCVKAPTSKVKKDGKITSTFLPVDVFKSRCHIRKDVGAAPTCDSAVSEVDWSSTATEECDKFVYDRSIYESTVATEFDLGMRRLGEVITE